MTKEEIVSYLENRTKELKEKNKIYSERLFSDKRLNEMQTELRQNNNVLIYEFTNLIKLAKS